MTPQLPQDILDKMPNEMLEAIAALKGLGNVPHAMSIPGVLAIANFAAQGLAKVHYEAWDKPLPLSEYFLVLNEASSGKSTMMGNITEGVNRFVKEEKEFFEKQLEEYKWEKKIYDNAMARAKADDTPPTKPEKPTGYSYKVATFTLNGLIDTLKDVPFAGLMNADASTFFNSYAFQNSGDNKDKELVAALSAAFSGEEIERRTGENITTLYGRCFSMFALLQPGLANFLVKDDFVEQGFTNRFLITQSELFKVPLVDFIDPAAKLKKIKLNRQLTAFNDRIYKMLKTVHQRQAAQRRKREEENRIAGRPPAAGGSSDANQLDLQIIRLAQDNATLQLAMDFCNEFGGNRPDTAQNGSSLAFYARCYEHACRLAATLALFEDPYAEEISNRYLHAGIGLVRWFIEQREAISVPVSVVQAQSSQVAEEVVKWWEKNRPTELFDERGLFQKGPVSFRRLKPRSKREEVIEELLLLNLVETVSEADGSTKLKLVVDPGAGDL